VETDMNNALASESMPTPSRIPNRGSELRRALPPLVPELRARALRLSRSMPVAEDLVQDTVERAIRFESHFIPGTNVRAWVLKILFSVFITRCRRSRRERNALQNLSTDPNAWTLAEPTQPGPELSPTVKVALHTLPPNFRRAVELVDLDELSYRDAADEMGVPVGTVMSRLHRGRKMLSTLLAPVQFATDESPSIPVAA
jgi:RNA polymerase sigma-70 factor, ECF subfamily